MVFYPLSVPPLVCRFTPVPISKQPVVASRRLSALQWPAEVYCARGSSNYEIVRVPGGSGPVYHSSQRLNQSPGLSRQAPLTAVTRSNTIRIELQFRKTSSKHHEKTKGNVLCGGAMKLLKLHTKSRKQQNLTA